MHHSMHRSINTTCRLWWSSTWAASIWQAQVAWVHLHHPPQCTSITANQLDRPSFQFSQYCSVASAQQWSQNEGEGSSECSTATEPAQAAEYVGDGGGQCRGAEVGALDTEEVTHSGAGDVRASEAPEWDASAEEWASSWRLDYQLQVYEDTMHNIRDDHVPKSAWLIMNQLASKGHNVYVVGGTVRDILLNRQPKDFDITTSATINQIKQLFGGRAHVVGRKHPIVVVLSGGQPYEVSSLHDDEGPAIPQNPIAKHKAITKKSGNKQTDLEGQGGVSISGVSISGVSISGGNNKESASNTSNRGDGDGSVNCGNSGNSGTGQPGCAVQGSAVQSNSTNGNMALGGSDDNGTSNIVSSSTGSSTSVNQVSGGSCSVGMARDDNINRATGPCSVSGSVSNSNSNSSGNSGNISSSSVGDVGVDESVDRQAQGFISDIGLRVDSDQDVRVGGDVVNECSGVNSDAIKSNGQVLCLGNQVKLSDGSNSQGKPAKRKSKKKQEAKRSDQNDDQTARGLSSHVAQLEEDIRPIALWGAARLHNCRSRDFTVNSLLYEPSNRLVLDYMGAYKDIQNKALRTCYNPFQSFQDDPARMLRAIRLASRAGLSIEPWTRKAMQQHAHLIETLSSDRIVMEINQMMSQGASAGAMKLLWHAGLLHRLLPYHAQLLQSTNFPTALDKQPGVPNMLIDMLTELDKFASPSEPVSQAAFMSILVAPIVSNQMVKVRHLVKEADERLKQQAEALSAMQASIEQQVHGEGLGSTYEDAAVRGGQHSTHSMEAEVVSAQEHRGAVSTNSVYSSDEYGTDNMFMSDLVGRGSVQLGSVSHTYPSMPSDSGGAADNTITTAADQQLTTPHVQHSARDELGAEHGVWGTQSGVAMDDGAQIQENAFSGTIVHSENIEHSGRDYGVAQYGNLDEHYVQMFGTPVNELYNDLPSSKKKKKKKNKADTENQQTNQSTLTETHTNSDINISQESQVTESGVDGLQSSSQNIHVLDHAEEGYVWQMGQEVSRADSTVQHDTVQHNAPTIGMMNNEQSAEQGYIWQLGGHDHDTGNENGGQQPRASGKDGQESKNTQSPYTSQHSQGLVGQANDWGTATIKDKASQQLSQPQGKKKKSKKKKLANKQVDDSDVWEVYDPQQAVQQARTTKRQHGRQGAVNSGHVSSMETLDMTQQQTAHAHSAHGEQASPQLSHTDRIDHQHMAEQVSSEQFIVPQQLHGSNKEGQHNQNQRAKYDLHAQPASTGSQPPTREQFTQAHGSGGSSGGICGTGGDGQVLSQDNKSVLGADSSAVPAVRLDLGPSESGQCAQYYQTMRELYLSQRKALPWMHMLPYSQPQYYVQADRWLSSFSPLTMQPYYTVQHIESMPIEHLGRLCGVFNIKTPTPGVVDQRGKIEAAVMMKLIRQGRLVVDQSQQAQQAGNGNQPMVSAIHLLSMNVDELEYEVGMMSDRYENQFNYRQWRQQLHTQAKEDRRQLQQAEGCSYAVLLKRWALRELIAQQALTCDLQYTYSIADLQQMEHEQVARLAIAMAVTTVYDIDKPQTCLDMLLFKLAEFGRLDISGSDSAAQLSVGTIDSEEDNVCERYLRKQAEVGKRYEAEYQGEEEYMQQLAEMDRITIQHQYQVSDILAMDNQQIVSLGQLLLGLQGLGGSPSIVRRIIVRQLLEQNRLYVPQYSPELMCSQEQEVADELQRAVAKRGPPGLQPPPPIVSKHDFVGHAWPKQIAGEAHDGGVHNVSGIQGTQVTQGIQGKWGRHSKYGRQGMRDIEMSDDGSEASTQRRGYTLTPQQSTQQPQYNTQQNEHTRSEQRRPLNPHYTMDTKDNTTVMDSDVNAQQLHGAQAHTMNKVGYRQVVAEMQGRESQGTACMLGYHAQHSSQLHARDVGKAQGMHQRQGIQYMSTMPDYQSSIDNTSTSTSANGSANGSADTSANGSADVSADVSAGAVSSVGDDDPFVTSTLLKLINEGADSSTIYSNVVMSCLLGISKGAFVPGKSFKQRFIDTGMPQQYVSVTSKRDIPKVVALLVQEAKSRAKKQMSSGTASSTSKQQPSSAKAQSSDKLSAQETMDVVYSVLRNKQFDWAAKSRVRDD